MNCYFVALDRDKLPYFMARGIEGEKLTGLKSNGVSFTDDATLSISDLENGTLNITHYYGIDAVTYNSIYGVAWHYITKWAYLKIHIHRYIDSTHQYFFNKRKLVTKTRMELLQFMMNDQLDRTHNGIDLISLMSKIYSMRSFLHPSRKMQQQKLNLYLESLVLSEELKMVNHEYVVTGKAISTIEKYEEEERRHTEAVKLQWNMFWITLIAVIFTIVQSGVIKLPTIINWSETPSAEDVHNKPMQSTADSSG